MIPTTTMQLPKPETGDPMEPFFLGTQPDGGYWMTVTRLSEHDHTGGVLGKPITAATIPDGSITTSKLDPSVLAPYALTDGSKPFTGQVTMQADAVVRDALFFGEQGTALAPDVTLTRTAAGRLRLDTNLGVGVAPAAWHAGYPAAQIGAGGSVWSLRASSGTALADNTYVEIGGGSRALLSGSNPASQLLLLSGSLLVQTAPAVAAGAAQSFTTRLAVNPAGAVTLTPDAATPALVYTGRLSLEPQGTVDVVLNAIGAAGKVYANTTALAPFGDNAASSGLSTNRWTAVYAVAGTINTSAAEAKTDVTPLDPADALAAVLATDPVTFTYTAAAPTAEQYELPDDPEQAEQVLHERLVNGPLLAAARSQAGFVLSSPDYATDPLFETGEGQSNAANTAGVLLASIKELERRLTAGGL